MKTENIKFSIENPAAPSLSSKPTPAESSLSTPRQRPLWTGGDKFLAFSNVARLGLEYALPYASPRIADLLKTPLWVSTTFQTLASFHAAPPPDQRNLVETVVFDPLLLPLAGVCFGLPILNQVHSLAILVGVAQNSLPKLVRSAKEITKRPWSALGAMSLHAFNVISQGYFTHQELESLNKKPDDSQEKCSEGSASTYQNMAPLERFTSDLNPKCVADAEKAFKTSISPECLRAVGRNISVKKHCTDTCAKLKKEFLNLSLKIHPDRNADPKATEAFKNLNSFYQLFQCR